MGVYLCLKSRLIRDLVLIVVATCPLICCQTECYLTRPASCVDEDSSSSLPCFGSLTVCLTYNITEFTQINMKRNKIRQMNDDKDKLRFSCNKTFIVERECWWGLTEHCPDGCSVYWSMLERSPSNVTVKYDQLFADAYEEKLWHLICPSLVLGLSLGILHDLELGYLQPVYSKLIYKHVMHLDVFRCVTVFNVGILCYVFLPNHELSWFAKTVYFLSVFYWILNDWQPGVTVYGKGKTVSFQ